MKNNCCAIVKQNHNLGWLKSLKLKLSSFPVFLSFEYFCSVGELRLQIRNLFWLGDTHSPTGVTRERVLWKKVQIKMPSFDSEIKHKLNRNNTVINMSYAWKDPKKKCDCEEDCEKRTLLLSWFFPSVNIINMSSSESERIRIRNRFIAKECFHKQTRNFSWSQSLVSSLIQYSMMII